MAVSQSDAEIITLPSSAILYMTLRKTAHLIFFALFITLYAFGKFHARVPPGTVPQATTHIGTVFFFAALGLVVLFLIQIGYFYLLVHSYKIQVRNDGVSIHYGVLNISNELLLFNKIQDIVINRNILQRLMGLSTVVIQNAMGKPGIIPGLEEATAERVREQILSHVNKQA